MTSSDTIAAVATAPGTGGIAVIRISGPRAVEIADSAWKGRPLAAAESRRATLGMYVSTEGTVLDEALAVVFRAPHSFTGENVVELSVHGSRWIQREVLSDLVRRGARPAGPGEFTQRAFLNGRLDLAQAEGVADLIAASSKAAHRLAMTQTRGGFSRELDSLRERLVEFASLLELELDFSEEDVEFADRTRLRALAAAILAKVERLAASYSSGAALKEGLPVVIAGVPNAGKSSLLNLILGDDKAIVSDIPGTTRDTIEDTIELDGVLYRFVDTAGLRKSDDAVESIGIDRARSKMRDARIIIWILDPATPLTPQLEELRSFRATADSAAANSAASAGSYVSAASYASAASAGESRSAGFAGSAIASPEIVLLLNKTDLADSYAKAAASLREHASIGNDAVIPFSTKTGEGLDALRRRLSEIAISGYNPDEEVIVTNARHYEALTKGASALRRAIEGIDAGISADFISQDVREATTALGTITGQIASSDLLHSIFSHFCIGK